MPEETIVTDDVTKIGDQTDVVTDDLIPKTGEEEVILPDETTSQKVDAGRKESAKIAWRYREEKRKRMALEAEVVEIKAKQATLTQDKPVMPKYENFESQEAYTVATAEYHEKLTDWKLTQREIANAQKITTQEFFKTNQQLYDSFLEKAEKASEKYPDFEEKIRTIQVSEVAREAIYKATNSAEISYHLANNPEFAQKLLTLSSVDTTLEIHKLDLKIGEGLKKKTVSKAPEPITPIENSQVSEGKEESTSDYIRRRNKEQFGR